MIEQKIAKFVRQNWYWITLLLLIAAIFLQYQFGTVSFKSETIQRVFDNKIQESIMIRPTNIHPILIIVSNVLVSLAITVFISVFFMKVIESTEREKFEKRLEAFQQKTAENAILSTFKTLIDEEYIEILKQDVFNKGLVRRDAKWQYDFEIIEGNKIKLVRTITYNLRNTSEVDQKEEINPVWLNSQYCTTRTEAMRVRNENGKYDTLFDGKEQSSVSKEVQLKRGEEKEIVVIMSQVFSNPEYAYETHSVRTPVIGLELIANIPEDYNFTISCNMSSPLQCSIDERKKKVYSTKGAIYKGQGIEFVLEKMANNSVHTDAG